jgi:hypothetical protein
LTILSCALGFGKVAEWWGAGRYIFFEKKRIYENKPKGKKRIESEQE